MEQIKRDDILNVRVKPSVVENVVVCIWRRTPNTPRHDSDAWGVRIRAVWGGIHPDDGARSAVPSRRGLPSSTFQLNLSALYGIGGARRGCVTRVKGVLGDAYGV